MTRDLGASPTATGPAPYGLSRYASQAKPLVPSTDGAALSAWPERRPQANEQQRAERAKRLAAHLPETTGPIQVSDEDILALRAAHIRRFDEQLPRTETLFAVASIGYRMALRDAAQGIAARSDTTGTGVAVGKSPVAEGHAPKGADHA